RGIEVGLQLLTHEALDPVGAAQHAQPQPHRQVMIVVHAGFGIHIRLDQFERPFVFRHCFPLHQVSSPPANTMLCPVTLPEPGWQSHTTVSATSRGSIRRRCGFVATSAASASVCVRPVLLTMLAIALRAISVFTYPGQTAFTVMLRVAYSSA